MYEIRRQSESIVRVRPASCRKIRPIGRERITPRCLFRARSRKVSVAVEWNYRLCQWATLHKVLNLLLRSQLGQFYTRVQKFARVQYGFMTFNDPIRFHINRGFLYERFLFILSPISSSLCYLEAQISQP